MTERLDIRQCRKCGETKALDLFGAHTHGYRWICRACYIAAGTKQRRERRRADRRPAVPCQEVLRQLLDYNPETGRFFWKPRADKAWSTRYAGTEAFTSMHRGYRTGNILGGPTVRAHRVAFVYMYGYEPAQVDHINGDRSDNRLCNLREVTCSDNRRNSARPCNNTSGVIGVSRAPSGNWIAYIKVGGVMHNLGTHPTLEDAASARKAAEASLGFHPNHGREAAA